VRRAGPDQLPGRHAARTPTRPRRRPHHHVERDDAVGPVDARRSSEEAGHLMRATVLNGPGDVTVETVDDPTLPDAESVVVEITHTAICGSDLHLYPGIQGSPGVHLGHEFVGRVVEAGTDVRRFSVGDDVLVSGVIGCGRCVACLRGNPVRCAVSPRIFGTGLELPGGQAELAAV